MRIVSITFLLIVTIAATAQTGKKIVLNVGGGTDTTSLSSRIEQRLRLSDTATMLAPYLRAAGIGLVKNGQTVSLDTIFADVRSRNAISLTTVGNSGAATYNAGTGVINIPNYTLAGLGGVSIADTATMLAPYLRAAGIGLVKNGQTVSLDTTFTDVRSRNAISLTTVGNSGAATYNAGTGVLNVPNYTLAGLGGVSIADTATMLANYLRGPLTAGRIPFANGTNTLTTTPNLVWDAATNRLGVGTGSPTDLLHVNGSLRASTASLGYASSFTTTSVTLAAQGAAGGTVAIQASNNYTGTANWRYLQVGGGSFAPTSGTGNYEAIFVNPQVNQTGSATGQVRGIYIINNIIASNSTYRTIDMANIPANAYGIYQQGATARNFFAGSVGIGTDAPNATAALDVSSNERGVLIPRLTSVQAASISSPANGLMYYNTDSLRLMIRRSGTWRGVRFTDEGSGAALPNANELDILRYRNGQWVAEPDTVMTNGFIHVTGNQLLRYTGEWRTAEITDSSVLNKKHVDSLIYSANGKRILYNTNNATPVNASVESIADNTAGQLEVAVTVTNGSGNIKIIRRSYGYKKVSGTLTILSPSDIITTYADSGMSGADVNVVSSGGNAAIQVTGIAAPLNWSIDVKLIATVNIPV